MEPSNFDAQEMRLSLASLSRYHLYGTAIWLAFGAFSARNECDHVGDLADELELEAVTDGTNDDLVDEAP
jgi:hypothetical protein